MDELSDLVSCVACYAERHFRRQDDGQGEVFGKISQITLEHADLALVHRLGLDIEATDVKSDDLGLRSLLLVLLLIRNVLLQCLLMLLKLRQLQAEGEDVRVLSTPQVFRNRNGLNYLIQHLIKADSIFEFIAWRLFAR